MASRPRISRAPRRERARPSAFAIVVSYVLSIVIIIAMIGVIWLIAPVLIARQFSGAPPAITDPAPIGNVGGQAPPSVRGANAEIAAPRVVATPISGIAQNEEESLRIYHATAQAVLSAPAAAPAPESAPLPLNSAGAPVIDAQQQQQLDMSGQMAADEQQAALRAAQLVDAASRAPDVSKADADAMMHRDLCHVPRADPHTCEQGLFKPTPIGGG